VILDGNHPCVELPAVVVQEQAFFEFERERRAEDEPVRPREFHKNQLAASFRTGAGTLQSHAQLLGLHVRKKPSQLPGARGGGVLESRIAARRVIHRNHLTSTLSHEGFTIRYGRVHTHRAEQKYARGEPKKRRGAEE